MRVHMRNQAPLLGRRREAHAAVGRNPVAMQNDLHGRIFLIKEDRAIGVVVEHNAHTASPQVAVAGDLQVQVCSRCGQTEK